MGGVLGIHELLLPHADFYWLAEIEKDLALVMQPRSKFDRLVFATRLVEAGMKLVDEAERFARPDRPPRHLASRLSGLSARACR
jgi:hypothetical protein